jgi:hypothetical protein
MVYKRYPYLHRNYYYPTPKSARSKNSSQEDKSQKDVTREKVSDNIKLIEEIPMPNETEDIKSPEVPSTPGFRTAMTEYGHSNFPLARLFPHKINFEDILIIAIIFILMREEKRDDMLLIALVYLLL